MPISENQPGFGGEATAAIDVDVTASAEWINGQPQPETASRWGVSSAAYVRGSNEGFGVGYRPGVFVGSTNARMVFLGNVAAEGGLETLHGTAFASIGGVGAATGGFVVLSKSATIRQRSSSADRSRT